MQKPEIDDSFVKICSWWRDGLAMSGNNKTNNELKTEFRFSGPVVDGPVLAIPEPPADLHWTGALELLKSNGVAITGKSLLSTLECAMGMLKVAAAHTLGSMGPIGASAALQRLVEASHRQDTGRTIYKIGDCD